MAVGIAFLDHEVTALNKADIGKPLTYTTQCLSIGTFRSDPEIANPYPLIRLGKRKAKRRGLRPCGCRTADKGDELASPHSITSSATSRMSRLIVSPTALAAFRLMTSSNVVGRSTGKSAGLAPLSILSTYVALRRNRSSRFAP